MSAVYTYLRYQISYVSYIKPNEYICYSVDMRQVLRTIIYDFSVNLHVQCSNKIE